MKIITPCNIGDTAYFISLFPNLTCTGGTWAVYKDKVTSIQADISDDGIVWKLDGYTYGEFVYLSEEEALAWVTLHNRKEGSNNDVPSKELN